MERRRKDEGIYKEIVIIATGIFLSWGFMVFQQKVYKISTVLGILVVPILLYMLFKILKAIWPDLW